MLKVKSYSLKGIKKEDTALPKEYEVKVNLVGIAQAVRVYEDRLHPGLSKVKTRSEVSLSTRKIYRQKGTGGARHGAKSAPIFAGGGVAHGPKGIKKRLVLNKNIKNNAFLSALNMKIKEGSAAMIYGLNEIVKTKDAGNLLRNIFEDAKGSVLVALSNNTKNASLAFRNIKNVMVKPFKDLNALDLVSFKNLILDSGVFEDKKGDKKEAVKVVSKKVKNEIKRAVKTKRIVKKTSKK